MSMAAETNLTDKKGEQSNGLPFTRDDIAKTTPMMAQFMETKLQYPDCLLFYRMGDFYELFFNDAVTAAKALDIALTKRGTHNDEPIAMCGVPFHSYENYLTRLVKQGFKIAICEQVETPEEAKKRAKQEGGKALVKRDVVRIVTQGTLTEDAQLDNRANNYLLCLAQKNLNFAVSVIDISTGSFYLESVFEKDIPALIERYDPSEILLSENLRDHENLKDVLTHHHQKLSLWDQSRFDEGNGKKRLLSYYQVGTLEAFGDLQPAMIIAGGALLDYVELTQKGKLPHLERPQLIHHQSQLQIDASTRRNLEINKTMQGEKKGSLIHTLDRTITASGARLLSNWLNAPLADKGKIEERLNAVAFFKQSTEKRDHLRDNLKSCPDMERALARLSVDRGGPRDMQAVLNALDVAFYLKDFLKSDRGGQKIADDSLPESLLSILEYIKKADQLIDLMDHLERGLKQDLPMLSRDGGFVQKSYDPALDELKDLCDNSKKTMLEMEARYLKRAGVSNLKIKHNNVIGYYIEVPSAQAQPLFDDDEKFFIHRQTMANAVRFTSVELSELEDKMASAADKALGLELEIYKNWLDKIKQALPLLSMIAKAVAHLDVFASIAELALENDYCRPAIFEDTRFDVEQARHPVVEQHLSAEENFIPNDCCLNDTESRIWLLTGPNMAGKSTFLRQNALLVIMAQAGFYVPAKKAEIGLVDKIFSRVGAADDLARGQSTFMVEMVETAAILNQATERSLVILDEIGRGTSTFDGLSIAWACLEHLHDNNQCRSLFATHYHELTQLRSSLDKLACYTVKIKEWQNEVIFMHEVIAGEANRSYGIHVAKLAGLPAIVVKRSQAILDKLESDQQSGASKSINNNELPLFSQFKEQEKDAIEQEVLDEKAQALQEKLDQIDPDSLSPREALDLLYDLKK